eukprot:TRINITY_DN9620_c0_g1_i1.p1 TRINITY_DN9620_c0_g1~~TRINITY_DN9620_c0_g1_i1.p1  ORF type:complete len:102 (-),score=19.48 TRINITY_DN9620_c0_g1_i1:47-328(-)
MGLPTEFHLQSYVSFQSKYLQQLYGLAQEASLSVSDGVLKGSEMDIKVCSAALRLMCHILNWDFNNAICRTGTLLISGKGKRNTSEHSFVQVR